MWNVALLMNEVLFDLRISSLARMNWKNGFAHKFPFQFAFLLGQKNTDVSGHPKKPSDVREREALMND